MQYSAGTPEARWRTQGRDVFLGTLAVALAMLTDWSYSWVTDFGKY